MKGIHQQVEKSFINIEIVSPLLLFGEHANISELV